MESEDDLGLWLGKASADRSASTSHMLAVAQKMGGGGTPRGRLFTGQRIGRGAGIGRLLRSSPASAGISARRVVVQTRIAKLAGRGMQAAAQHLRYLQRDGTTRDNGRGFLYGPSLQEVPSRDFLERSSGDRHQFRIIVAVADGAEYRDLQPLARRLMEQAEVDLDTALDWAAVDHFDTGRPHTHIVLRGADDRGDNLIIAREYLWHGLPARAAALVELDLGPGSDTEITARLAHEIAEERYTRIDQILLGEPGSNVNIDPSHDDPQQHAARMGRLRTLEKMDLAIQQEDGRWTVDPELEKALRKMKRRHDIARTIARDIAAAQVYHLPADYVVHDPENMPGQRATGRVITIGRSDNQQHAKYMIIEGLDGKCHYANLDDDIAEFPKGSIVSFVGNKVELISMRPIKGLAEYSGPTWLDNELLSKSPLPLGNGFGREVAQALTQRQNWLVAKELAWQEQGSIRYQANLLLILQQNELDRAIAELVHETGLVHHQALPGERIEGLCRRAVGVGDTKYAFIEKARDFTLLPWRNLPENSIDLQVSGIMGEHGIHWDNGRAKGLSL